MIEMLLLLTTWSLSQCLSWTQSCSCYSKHQTANIEIHEMSVVFNCLHFYVVGEGIIKLTLAIIQLKVNSIYRS